MATIGYKIGRFQFQGGTKTELLGSELILLENEIALERDTETNSIKMRVGDGKSKYADCPYIDIGIYSEIVATKQDLNSYAKTTDIPKLVTLTQTEFDRLSYKDPNTYYFIKEQA